MFSFFAYPIFFYTLVLVLLIVSLIAVFSMGEEQARSRTRKDQELSGGRARINELEQELASRDQEFRATVQQLEKTFKDKEESYAKQLASFQEQSKSGEVVKSHLVSLQSQLNAKEESFAQATAARQALEQEALVVRQELEKTAKELSLANQMYNGLKGQYDEMEEKYSQLFQQFVTLQKSQKEGRADPGTAPGPRAPDGFKIPNLRAGVVDEKQDQDPPVPTA